MSDPIKPYSLTFEERPDYLYAHIRCSEMTREIALSYLSEIAERCNAMDCSRVVIERDVPVMLSSGDLFFTTQEFVRMMHGRRVAFINPHVTNEDDMNFALMIGNNRGAEFELHPTLASAERWLLHCLCLAAASGIPQIISRLPAPAEPNQKPETRNQKPETLLTTNNELLLFPTNNEQRTTNKRTRSGRARAKSFRDRRRRVYNSAVSL